MRKELGFMTLSEVVILLILAAIIALPTYHIANKATGEVTTSIGKVISTDYEDGYFIYSTVNNVRTQTWIDEEWVANVIDENGRTMECEISENQFNKLEAEANVTLTIIEGGFSSSHYCNSLFVLNV